MIRKKKPFRNVRDQNFLAIANMPFMENKQAVYEWLKSSKLVGTYVFKLCRREFALIATQQLDGSHLWQGINFDEEKRSWSINTTTAYSKRVTEAIYKDEIDLMPSLHHKFFDRRFIWSESEVAAFLASKKYIWQLIFNTAVYNGLLISLDDGYWIGKTEFEEDE